MKRAFLAITGTVAGLVALLSFKTHTVQLTAAPPPPAGSHPSGSRHGHSTANGAPPAPRSTPIRDTHVSSTPKQYVGSAVQTPYGIIEVALKVANGHITAVTLPRLQAFDSTSQMINSQAAPILVRETMNAQSAHINALSGATYTSEGYLQSLQSALNKAGL
jgi:uncharacterized protein with FMN-binding domain